MSRPPATWRRQAALLAAVILGGAGCAPGTGAPATGQPPATSPARPTAGAAASPTPGPSQLVLMTHDSFAISDEVLAEFETVSALDLQVLRAGDAGSMVNQAILARSAPLADVLYGVDNTFLSRALEADIFVPYRPTAIADVPAELHVAGDAATPIDYADVCLNYDRSAFSDELPPPSALEDLAQPAYRGMLVVENPATSSP